MFDHTKYPTIVKAAIEIAYDNGAVNRDNPEEDVVGNALYQVAREFPEAEITVVEAELSKLSEDQLYEICCGDSSGRDESAIAEKLLTCIFDNI